MLVHSSYLPYLRYVGSYQLTSSGAFKQPSSILAKRWDQIIIIRNYKVVHILNGWNSWLIMVWSTLLEARKFECRRFDHISQTISRRSKSLQLVALTTIRTLSFDRSWQGSTKNLALGKEPLCLPKARLCCAPGFKTCREVRCRSANLVCRVWEPRLFITHSVPCPAPRCTTADLLPST